MATRERDSVNAERRGTFMRERRAVRAVREIENRDSREEKRERRESSAIHANLDRERVYARQQGREQTRADENLAAVNGAQMQNPRDSVKNAVQRRMPQARARNRAAQRDDVPL